MRKNHNSSIDITCKIMRNIPFNKIKNRIEEEIIQDLDRIGIYYRIHSRTKTVESLQQKITTKGEGYYQPDGKKVQDMIGYRITTYFIDDVNLLWNYFSEKFVIVDKQYDLPTSDVFKPLRKNLICRYSDDNSAIFNEAKLVDRVLDLVDNTFEIQFRTTSSEGWHEVDHALRYKCKNDWIDYREEDKMFNGIYAILETTDRTLKSLFENMAYNHYKCKNWEAMLRMKFFLNFDKGSLSSALKDLLNRDNALAKKVFRCSRADLLYKIAISGLDIPVSFNNIVFLINYLCIKNEEISDLTPHWLVKKCDSTSFN